MVNKYKPLVTVAYSVLTEVLFMIFNLTNLLGLFKTPIVDKVICRGCNVLLVDTRDSCLWMCNRCHKLNMAEMLDRESRGNTNG